MALVAVLVAALVAVPVPVQARGRPGAVVRGSACSPTQSQSAVTAMVPVMSPLVLKQADGLAAGAATSARDDALLCLFGSGFCLGACLLMTLNLIIPHMHVFCRWRKKVEKTTGNNRRMM